MLLHSGESWHVETLILVLPPSVLNAPEPPLQPSANHPLLKAPAAGLGSVPTAQGPDKYWEWTPGVMRTSARQRGCPLTQAS